MGPEFIEVCHVLSGEKRHLRVGRYVKSSFLVEWELDLPIELKRDKSGLFSSRPKSFFLKWQLTNESKKALAEAILAEQQAVKNRILADRVRP